MVASDGVGSLQVLKGSLGATGTRSNYNKDPDHTADGVRCKISHTFANSGLSAAIFISLSGLTEIELPSNKTPGGVLTIKIEGLTIGGVPMIAIPITNGQPGVAARLAHAGVAKIVKPHQASVSNLNLALREILTDPSYRQKAKTLQNRIQTEAPSLSQTAKLITTAFKEKNQIKDNKVLSKV